jgi:type I restriction enzyme M protein
MTARISQQQLESYLWGAATLLRGTIDAGDYKQFIFPLLFFKRLCDVFDEEKQSALRESDDDEAFAAFSENHRFQIPMEAHWSKIRGVAKNLGQAIQSAMRTIETANPDKLYGIFGDAQWTNKDRLSDTMLRDLIEHFSSLELSLGNLPEDELGQGYEYLIKKFADDSGHTAAEFYTNRTIVHLMTELLEPKPSETVYDPTCGSGGMLLSCITQIRSQGREWRNVHLYGQERNLMTSSIARMNCFLHGIEDFQIARGDTLSEPKFVQGDRLMRFDVVLANPPYSIKQWDRDAFTSDPWGRNLYGTPPQGRADYAFWQHILCSLVLKTGRCAILFPHGVLFRQEESEMRRKIIEADLIECVLGLGPNLFYNSPMEACILICRATKTKVRSQRILFINAVNEVTRERAQSFLTKQQIERIVVAYREFKDEPGFTHVATLEKVRQKGASLNIPLYVVAGENTNGRRVLTKGGSFSETLSAWVDSGLKLRRALNELLEERLAAEPPALKFVRNLPLGLRRSEWKRLPFGEFADSVNERIEPSAAADEIYVGLDDLASDSLHIQRWGKGSDVIGTKLRFSKGDVIFGRRRAYQRKLAVAEMNGICSAHAMVARARQDVMLPEFLPFLMMSDAFMGRAVEISVGSLSPTINWTTLKMQKFDVPSLDQQRRIAEILWAVDESEQRKSKIATDARELLAAKLEQELDRHFEGPCDRLDHLLLGSPESGSSAPPSPIETGHYVLSLAALSRRGYVQGSLKPVQPSKAMLNARLSQNDFLISRSNTRELVGLVGIFDEKRDDVSFPDTMMRLPVDEVRILKQYLEVVLLSRRGRLHMMSAAAGTSGSMKKINRRTLGNCSIPTPGLSAQEHLLNKVRCVQEAADSAEAAYACTGRFKLALLEWILDSGHEIH